MSKLNKMLLEIVLTLCRFEAVATVLLAYILYLVVSRLRNPLRKIPGPKGGFILGNTLDLGTPKDPQKVLLEWNKTYGDVFKTWNIMGGYRVHIANPEHIKSVLVTSSTHYHRPGILARLFDFKIIGKTLFDSHGKEHALRRKLLNPSFSYASVQNFIPVFNKAAQTLIQFWHGKISETNGKFDEAIQSKFTCLTLDVIGETAFGYKFNSINGGHSKEARATDTILRGQFDMKRRSLEMVFPFFKLIPSEEKAKVDEAKTILNETVLKVIKEKKMKGKEEKSKENEKDFLQILLDLHENGSQEMNDVDLLSEVRSFMIAGHETTSITMTWTILLLAKHQEYQERAREEVRKVLQDKEEITLQDVTEMKFLDNCIKESMRLYPPVILIGRRAMTDVKIGPYFVPKGTTLLVDVTSSQRNEEFWKDAHIFNPNRYDNKTDNNNELQYRFMPFSRGPRMCIGYRFAEVELKVVLAKLLKSFRFQLGEDHPDYFKGDVLLTLRPVMSPIVTISIAD